MPAEAHCGTGCFSDRRSVCQGNSGRGDFGFGTLLIMSWEVQEAPNLCVSRPSCPSGQFILGVLLRGGCCNSLPTIPLRFDLPCNVPSCIQPPKNSRLSLRSRSTTLMMTCSYFCCRLVYVISLLFFSFSSIAQICYSEWHFHCSMTRIPYLEASVPCRTLKFSLYHVGP